MSFPAYFPPSKSEIKSLPSTTKEIVFDTSNWPSERTKMANQSKDPHSPDFNWFFWCGLPNKEDVTSFIEKYNRDVAAVPYFYGDGANPNKIIDENEKDPLKNRILKKCIDQIDKDIERSGTTDQNELKMLRNILFTLYINKYHRNLFYQQGENFLLVKIIKLAKLINPSYAEPLAYLLFHTLLFKCDIKTLFYPCLSMGRGNGIINFYSDKVINPEQFLGFFFIIMLIKMHPTLLDTIKQKSDTYKRQFFTELCRGASQVYSGPSTPMGEVSLHDFKKIVGDTIVKKNVVVYLSYMLSYWKSNLDVSDSWRRFMMTGDDINPAITNSGAIDAPFFLNTGLRNPNIYSTPLSTVDFEKIFKFLMKKKRMTQIVKMAKKNFSITPTGNRGNMQVQFKKPISFLKKPLRGGKRTRRNYKNTNRYTIKKR